MNAPAKTVSPADIEAARLLLERIGVAPEQLLQSPDRTVEMPTFRNYIPRVAALVSDGTRRAYSTYWNRVLAEWGDRLIDEPTPLEIKILAEETKTKAVTRRNTRGGRSAAEHMISALRCIYRYAIDDELIDASQNPAIKVTKPRRQPSTRQAIPDNRLAEVNHIASTTGNDPALDVLILRLHTETACRRAGALALRPQDLDREQCLVLLREKGEIARWQPISPTLMSFLIAHHEQRGNGEDDEQLLRYKNGNPLTTRRYDHLWHRIGTYLPWAATQGVSAHWLRHTTLTWVERRFGYGVARAFAGHNGNHDPGATATYIRANIQDVAIALATLTGEDHPLGQAQRGHGGSDDANQAATTVGSLAAAHAIINSLLSAGTAR